VDFSGTEKSSGLAPGLMGAVLHVENPQHNPLAKSPKNALGLFQITPETAATYGVQNPADLFDPVKNEALAGKILSDLSQRFRNPDGTPDIPRVLAAYNAGPGAVNSWGNNFWGGLRKYPETAAYVAQGLAKLHGGSAAGNVPNQGTSTPPQAPPQAATLSLRPGGVAAPALAPQAVQAPPVAPAAPAPVNQSVSSGLTGGQPPAVAAPAAPAAPPQAPAAPAVDPQQAVVAARLKRQAAIQEEARGYQGSPAITPGSTEAGEVAKDMIRQGLTEVQGYQNDRNQANQVKQSIAQLHDLMKTYNPGAGADWLHAFTAVVQHAGYGDLIPSDLKPSDYERFKKIAAQMSAGEGARGSGSEKWLENAQHFNPDPNMTDDALYHLMDTLEGNADYLNDRADAGQAFFDKYKNMQGFRAQFDTRHTPLDNYRALQAVAAPSKPDTERQTVVSEVSQMLPQIRERIKRDSGIDIMMLPHYLTPGGANGGGGAQKPWGDLKPGDQYFRLDDGTVRTRK
jgi:Transglycosylase SLT domain